MLGYLNICFYYFIIIIIYFLSSNLANFLEKIAAIRCALFLKGMGSGTLAYVRSKENSKGNVAGTLRAFKQHSPSSNSPVEKDLVYLL